MPSIIMFNEADIQNALNGLIAADPDFITDWGTYSIGRTDPKGTTNGTLKSCATQIMAYNEGDATVGTTGIGTEISTTKIALVIYYPNTTRDNIVAYDESIRLTNIARQIINRNRIYNDPATGRQLWYGLNLVKPGTLHFSSESWRQTLSVFDIYTRQRRT